MDDPRTELLSPVDAAWLRADGPTNRMVNTGALLFDEPLDFQALKAALAERLAPFRRFRQRVVRPALPLAPPYWEDDPYFDLGAHLHRVALPAPGDDAALRALVGDLLGTPLDPSRPLWQAFLVENCGGGSALLARVHHCVADGVALMQVLRAVAGPAPEASGAGPVPAGAEVGGTSPLQALLEPVTTGTHSTLRLAEAMAHKGIEALFHPAEAAELVRGGATAAASLWRLLLLEPDPGTLLKEPLGTAKRAAWSGPVPLRDVAAIGRAAGASSHEVLLCAAAGALRRYLRQRGQRVSGVTLRAIMPVSLRPRGAGRELGNCFGPVLLPLPVGLADPGRRLSALRRGLAALRESSDAEGTLAISALLGVLPGQVEGAVIDLLGSKATLVLSSLVGPHAPVRLAGQPARRVLFWVPQAGRVGLGLSLCYYAGAVTLGVAADAGLVPDPESIATGFEEEFEQMRGPPGQGPGKAPRTRRRARGRRGKDMPPPPEPGERS